jgi:hypothetical protein
MYWSLCQEQACSMNHSRVEAECSVLELPLGKLGVESDR